MNEQYETIKEEFYGMAIYRCILCSATIIEGIGGIGGHLNNHTRWHEDLEDEFFRLW